MSEYAYPRRRSILAAGIGILGVAAISLSSPTGVLAQGRDRGDRGSRGSGQGGDSRPSRQYDSGPSRRDDASPPRREVSPPARREDSSPSRWRDSGPPARREDPPARRWEPPARGNYSPPSRREEAPARARDYSPPVRRDDPPARRWEPPVRRDDPPARWRDSAPPSRRDDLPTRREDAPARWRDNNNAPARQSDPPDRLRDDNRPARRDTAPTRWRDNNPPAGRDNSPALGRDNAPSGGDRRQGGMIGRPGAGSLDRGQSRPGVSRDLLRGDRGDRHYGGVPRRNDAFSIFTRSREGRQYRNGIALRQGGYISDYRMRHYFSDSWAYYPWYYPTYDAAVAYYSPYSFYVGVCAPYIYRRHTWYHPPTLIYIEVPIYSGSECRGYDGDVDEYYLSRDQYWDEPDDSLRSAMDDIRAAFLYSEIERLVDLTDSQTRIAVYRRGHYEYSLDANDYLDMTRDAMRSMDTVSFDLYRARRRSADVYVVSGKHVYNDRDNSRRTVYVSFVMERIGGRWTITQVGTAPDRL